MDSLYEYDDRYLPSHLCLVGLAQQINKNRQSCVRDGLPRVRQMQGFGASYDLVPQPSCYVQGYTPQVIRIDVSGSRGREARGFDDRFDGSRSRDGWPHN